MVCSILRRFAWPEADGMVAVDMSEARCLAAECRRTDSQWCRLLPDL